MYTKLSNEEYSPVHSYQLTPEQLNEIYAKYGLPGELSPGLKATRKRSRFLSANNWASSLKKKPAAEVNKNDT